jgi:predicted phage terminase large subunit-like protein
MLNFEEYDALTRLDFNVFVERVFAELNGSAPYLDNFHIAAMCAELEEVRLGDLRRLAIALPPRSLKSIVVSVAYPAWLLGHEPTTKIICASYGQQLADSLARNCRQVMQSDWYGRLFPAAALAADRQSLSAFETVAGGERRATSVGGVLTGFGADVIIVDDPTKPEEVQSDAQRKAANEWARHTLFSRLNNKGDGAIILVQQRQHEDDMIGHVATFCELKLLSFAAIAQADEHYVIPTPHGVREHRRAEGEALHAEREPLSVLEEIRHALGSYFFSAQYLQMPAPPGGSIVKAEWFPRYDLANPPVFDEVFQSWDTASKDTELADFSVCTTWGRKDNQLFLRNVLRKKLEYPDLKRAVIDHAMDYRAKIVLIEDASAGQALIQDLKRDRFDKVRPIKPEKDKVMRLRAQTSRIEAGLVFIPHAAPWLDDYLHELTMFPATRHDDQVDSTSQALAHVLEPEPIASAGFLDHIRQENRNRLGEDVKADHPEKTQEAHLSSGRYVTRSWDGRYHFTPTEWEGLNPGWGFVKVEEG